VGSGKDGVRNGKHGGSAEAPKTPAKKEKPSLSPKYTVVLEDYATDESGFREKKVKDTFDKLDDAMHVIGLRMRGDGQIRYIKDIMATDQHFMVEDIGQNP
jgi:hypothetical protein